jgi:putative ABC transport system permease protein
MNPFIALEVGMREVFSHKFRSFLSMLGIVLGVSSLVATLGLTAGMEKGTRSVLQAMGGMERVQVVKQDISADQIDFWTLSPGRTFLDSMAIRQAAPLVTHISPELRHHVAIEAGGETARQSIWGVVPDFFPINQHEIAHGRWISDLDVELANRVTVIGHSMARRFFPNDHPSEIPGKLIFFNQVPYEIVGVLTHYERDSDVQLRQRGVRPPRRGGRWDPFRQKNETMAIPFTTMFYDFKAGQFPDFTVTSMPVENLVFRVKDLENFEQAIQQVRATLDITHRGVDDYDFETRQEQYERMESSLRATRFSGGLIAAISLLVGGIGITNVMLASISERVREIGIRRAIGARAADIFFQILIESLVIALMGAVLGIAAGFLLMQILIWVAPEQNMPIMTASSVVISMTFAAVAGVLSGLYPAIKAANLDPITALRYE